MEVKGEEESESQRVKMNIILKSELECGSFSKNMIYSLL